MEHCHILGKMVEALGSIEAFAQTETWIVACVGMVTVIEPCVHIVEDSMALGMMVECFGRCRATIVVGCVEHHTVVAVEDRQACQMLFSLAKLGCVKFQTWVSRHCPYLVERLLVVALFVLVVHLSWTSFLLPR